MFYILRNRICAINLWKEKMFGFMFTYSKNSHHTVFSTIHIWIDNKIDILPVSLKNNFEIFWNILCQLNHVEFNPLTVVMLQNGLCFRFEYPYKNDICVRIFSIFADLYIQDTIDSTCFWYNHFSPFHFKLNAQLNYIPWTKPSKGKGDKIKEHIENRLEQSVRTIK